MTTQEAAYWKRFIIKTIEDRLPLISPSTEDAIAISEFAKQNMRTITGQQMLPQGVFRKFLGLFGNFPIVIDELKKAQDAINELIEGVECSTKEVEHMFDGEMYDGLEGYMWIPSMDIDDDGYAALNMFIDNDGYANFLND